MAARLAAVGGSVSRVPAWLRTSAVALRGGVFLGGVYLGGSERVWHLVAGLLLALAAARPATGGRGWRRFGPAAGALAAWAVLASAWGAVLAGAPPAAGGVVLAAVVLLAVAERERWLPRVEPRLAAAAAWIDRVVLPHAALFLLVTALASFYGQLDRKQSGDTYASVYTAVAIARDGTLRLDRYLPILQIRAGDEPGQVERGDDGHLYSHFPVAAALPAVPAMGALAVAGVAPENWTAHMEAGFFTGALVAAAAVALFFVLLTRLTTRRRAFLIAALFAWATPMWTIVGQGLWQHGPAVLALVAALLALVDRRWALAGFALAAMVAFRHSAFVVALTLAPLIPLLARSPAAVVRAALGAAPPLAGVLAYNRTAFGCVTCTGYGEDFESGAGFTGPLLEGLAGNLLSPERSIFVYAPVLVLAVVGAVLARRRPLYLFATLALVAHLLLVSKWFEWWGGEAFGPRQLVDVLPLFALLLVPVLDRWADSARLRWTFGSLAAASVAIQFLGAALWPGTGWYDTHAVREFATWWNPLDSELTALFSDPARLAVRGALMALVSAGAVLLGLGAVAVRSRVGRSRGRAADSTAAGAARA